MGDFQKWLKGLSTLEIIYLSQTQVKSYIIKELYDRVKFRLPNLPQNVRKALTYFYSSKATSTKAAKKYGHTHWANIITSLRVHTINIEREERSKYSAYLIQQQKKELQKRKRGRPSKQDDAERKMYAEVAKQIQEQEEYKKDTTSNSFIADFE